jgi:hypothetical protein
VNLQVFLQKNALFLAVGGRNRPPGRSVRPK